MTARDRPSPPGARARVAVVVRRLLSSGEGGFVAGGEALALGVVVFVTGTLLVLSGWSLVDGKLAVEAAAREAARAVVEAPVAVLDDAPAVVALADARARSTMAAHRGPDTAPDATWRFVDTSVTAPGIVRCAPVTATVVVEVRTVRLPLLGGGLGTVRLQGQHVERLEPYRSGLPTGTIRC